MLKKIGMLLLHCLGAATVSLAQKEPDKITYAIKGADTLWFHHYKPQVKPNGISVVFVHGGSFTGGNPVNQQPFAEGLTKLGYNIFVIKYRLYLKGKSFGCEVATPEKLKAIQVAAEDASDASNYIIQHASNLLVDTTRLFIAGSSAGAEAVLNLVFNPFKKKGEAMPKRFAGLLSFAGAVLDVNTLSREAWIPVLMMHGTRDQLVPYGTAAHRFCKAADAGWLMMFGSQSILEKAQTQKLPAILYAYEGGGHEVSNYMFRKFEEMDRFMKAVVSKKHIKPALIKRK